MAYELEGINPSQSFGDYIVFNVFQWPPIVDYCRTVAPDIMDQVSDWLVNEGQGLNRADAAELGRLLLVSLLDGRFEQAAAEFDPEEYLARPESIGERHAQYRIRSGHRNATGRRVRAEPGPPAARWHCSWAFAAGSASFSLGYRNTGGAI